MRLRVKKLRGFGRTHREIAKEVGVSLGPLDKGNKDNPDAKACHRAKKKKTGHDSRIIKKTEKECGNKFSPA